MTSYLVRRMAQGCVKQDDALKRGSMYVLIGGVKRRPPFINIVPIDSHSQLYDVVHMDASAKPSERCNEASYSLNSTDNFLTKPFDQQLFDQLFDQQQSGQLGSCGAMKINGNATRA